MSCELCTRPQATLLHEDEQLYVILVDEPGYPGFCRVIWKAHVKEMSDLEEAECRHLMDWVLRTERAIRQVMNPDKINLVSLGNVVPHLHWHVIPRFADDAHFPAPIWASAARAGANRQVENLAEQLRAELSRSCISAGAGR